MNDVTIQYLPSGGSDAARLASRIGVSAHEIALHQFPDGELRVTVGPATTTTIIYAPLDRPNDKLLALLFAAEALRRDGAKRLVLVAPYVCYMRQDTAFQKGEAISQKVVGRLLATVVNRVITVDAHLHRTSDIRDVFPGIEADNLSAMPVIADALRTPAMDPKSIVVGPDAESRPWVSDLAGRLGLDHAIAQKARRSDHTVEIGFPDRDGAKAVRIQGDEIKVAARIRYIDEYSGHADGPELARWIAARRPVHRGVFLVHGEEPAIAGLSERIAERTIPAAQVFCPILDDIYELSTSLDPEIDLNRLLSSPNLRFTETVEESGRCS